MKAFVSKRLLLTFILVIIMLMLLNAINKRGGFAYIMIRGAGLFNRDTEFFTREYHKEKLRYENCEQFKIQLLIVGDSHVVGMGTITRGQSAVFMGIGGDTTRGVLNRLDVIGKLKPKNVAIEIGANDLAIGLEPNKVVGNYRKIISMIKIREPMAIIAICSILPMDENKLSPACFFKNTAAQKLNTLLAELAREEQISYIDLYHLFCDERDQIRGDYFIGDGSHLTRDGYRLFFEVIKKHLNIE